MAKLLYNNSVPSFTKETVFYPAYRTHSKIPDGLQFSLSIKIPSACEYAKRLVNLGLHFDKRWLQSRQHARNYYNTGHTSKKLNISDVVWLSARNIRKCLSKKLDYKFHGSFRIIKCIGTQAYQLDLPDALKNIHDVFYISLLKTYRTVKRRKPDPSPLIDVDDEDQAEIEKVLNSKIHYGKHLYLVKWLGSRWLTKSGLQPQKWQ